METIALCVFLSGACFGLFMAYRHFTHAPIPAPAALIHGILGATGLVILLLTVLPRASFDSVTLAFAVFAAAAVLGFVNLSFHLRKKRHRSALIVLHGLVAVSGAGILLFAILKPS